jgi:hypothetical protein
MAPLEGLTSNGSSILFILSIIVQTCNRKFTLVQIKFYSWALIWYKKLISQIKNQRRAQL